MEEGTVAIIALFVPQEGGAVFGGAKLRPKMISKKETKEENKKFGLPQDTVTIGRPIHSGDTSGSILLSRICNVDTNALIRIAARLGLAHNNLVNITILSEVFLCAKCLEELVLVAY